MKRRFYTDEDKDFLNTETLDEYVKEERDLPVERKKQKPLPVQRICIVCKKNKIHFDASPRICARCREP